MQGYAYDARRRIARLARALGKGDEAERLDGEATDLAARIGERYWLEDRAFFAEALDGRKARVDALTSNPGHLLWSGAVGPDSARAIAKVLLGPEMFSGFGIRPTACRPQAWASGAVLLLTRSLLGLDVDALAREVSVEPLAVAGLTRLTLKGVAVGGARVDVSVRRDGARGMVAELSGLPSGWRRVDRGS